MRPVLPRMTVPRTLVVFALLLWGWMGYGADLIRADEVPYRHFTTFDGLPGNQVTGLTQTPNGLLWVGTGSGLAMYDGHEYREIAFPDSLGTAYVYSMGAGRNGSVWVSPFMSAVAKVGENGLERIFFLDEGAYIRRILSKDGEMFFLGTSNYWTLSSDADSPVRHSYQYETQSVSEIDEDPDSGVGVFDAALDSKGRIWVLDGRRGPGRLHADGSVSFAGVQYGTPGEFWYEIGFAADGSGVLTKGRRLIHFDTAANQFREVTNRLGDPTYLSVDGSVAYATRDHTVLRYDVTEGKMRTPLGPGVGLPETMAQRVFRSREGALWIGTRDGLVQVMNPNVRVLESVDGTSLYNVQSFAAGEKALWARTHGAGMIQLRPEREIVRPDGIVGWKYDIQGRDGFLHALGSSNRIWIRWQSSTGWRRVREAASAIGGVVLADGRGYFRHPDGLYRYPPDPEIVPDTLLSWSVEDDFTRLAPAGDDALLLQKNEYLFRVESSPGTVLDTLGTLPTPQRDAAKSLGINPRSPAMDDARRVWTTDPSGGLFRLDPATGDRRMMLDSVSTWKVRALGDSLILATSRDRGLYVVDAATGAVREHLTQADGLKSNEVLAAHLQADTLYLAHSRGISLFPAEDLYREQSSPPVLLTELEVGAKRRPLRTDVRPELDERTIGFSYTAPSLSYADRISYSVRLGSQEAGGEFGNWESTTRRFIRYANLEPGTYRFEVRARLGDAPPGPAATYSFSIVPFFYETWWFRLLVVLGLIGIGAAVYRWRTFRHRQRQEKLEAAVKTRTEKLQERTEELAAEKQKTEKQAERLAELDEAKNRFFAHVSHEFRTPLSLILTPLEEALRNATADTISFGTEQVERMVHNAQHLQRLIEQLLDLATLETGRMELDCQLGELNRVVRRSAKAFVSMAEREGIDLQVRTAGDRLQTRFDPEKIESIVNNLLSNALKFTPKGGDVIVWIGKRTTPRFREDREAIIKVADTGPGMDVETQDRIFERFEHARQPPGNIEREREGAGLGLALTKELVELHGGTIEVESSLGEGTIFTVALPLVPTTEATTSGGESGDGAWTHGSDGTRGDGTRGDERKRVSLFERARDGDTGAEEANGESDEEAATVLVVEDNAEMRAYLREQLSPHWQVRTASDGEDGWQVVQEEVPDLVLSDVMMPEVGGSELCRRLKEDEELRAIPVILLTAQAAEEDVLGGLESGADDYLAKPFDARELRQRIENHLAARRRVRECHQDEVQVEALDALVEKEEVPFLETVSKAVKENISDPDFTAERLADEVALSRRQLTRRLKRAVGETPAAFVRQCRIRRAGELLTSGSGTIEEVAYAVGFRSPSHFSQVFREETGCTPSNFQAENGTGSNDSSSV